MLHIAFFTLLFTCFSVTAETMKVYTVDYPPFQSIDSQTQRTGYSIELLEKAAQAANIEFIYVDLPWARAQRVAEQEPNSLIFTLAKTKEREKRFLWIASIYQVRDGLYALASRNDIQIQSLSDVYNYSIALPVGDVSLHKLDILPDHDELVFFVNSQEHAINMLKLGRTDLNHNNDVGFNTAVHNMSLSPDLFKRVYVTSLSEMGVATSKKTDPALVRRLQESLKRLRFSGVATQLQRKWFERAVKQP